jgi:hypothetical protein
MQLLQAAGVDHSQIQALQAQVQIARGQQAASHGGAGTINIAQLSALQALQAQHAQALRAQHPGPTTMNAQQMEFLRAVGVDPTQIETLQAQAHAHRAQQGLSPGSSQPQPIFLTINRDGAGGLNVSGLENFKGIVPNGGNGASGGIIKIPSPFKDPHGPNLSFFINNLSVSFLPREPTST